MLCPADMLTDDEACAGGVVTAAATVLAGKGLGDDDPPPPPHAENALVATNATARKTLKRNATHLWFEWIVALSALSKECHLGDYRVGAAERLPAAIVIAGTIQYVALLTARPKQKYPLFRG